ncbi:serine hydrolase, partial [Kibdelosporangium lantanae]
VLTSTFGLGMDMTSLGTPIMGAVFEQGLTPNLPEPMPGPDEWMRRLGTLPLMHQPGERWQYQIASDLLGVLVARVTGQSFETVLRERVFDPLGMATLGLGLFGVLWAMTQLATKPLEGTQIAYLVGGLIMLVAFVFIELRQREPMLDLSLFRIPGIAPSLLASLCQGLAGFAVLFLVSEQARHITMHDLYVDGGATLRA